MRESLPWMRSSMVADCHSPDIPATDPFLAASAQVPGLGPRVPCGRGCSARHLWPGRCKRTSVGSGDTFALLVPKDNQAPPSSLVPSSSSLFLLWEQKCPLELGWPPSPPDERQREPKRQLAILLATETPFSSFHSRFLVLWRRHE